jgi:hypothetical protein
MISIQECTKILNAGAKKYTHNEILLIRDFLTSLSTIEVESFKQKELSSEPGNKLAPTKNQPTE